MYLDVLKEEERYGWCSWRLNDSMKGTRDAFRGYKEKSKVCSFYLEVKLHQDRCGYAFRNLHLGIYKNGRNKYLETNNHQTRY